MSAYELLKILHQSCAFASIAGFAMRGYWMLTGNPLLQQRLAKVLPHLVDTALLASAITMLLILDLSPLQLPWVLAKLVALLLYIGLGMVALRFGRSRRTRVTAYLLALLCAAYILSVAWTKSALGVLIYT